MPLNTGGWELMKEDDIQVGQGVGSSSLCSRPSPQGISRMCILSHGLVTGA